MAQPELIFFAESEVAARISILLLAEILDLLADALHRQLVPACKLCVVSLLRFSRLNLPIELELGIVVLLQSLLVMIESDFTSLEGAHRVKVLLTELGFGLDHVLDEPLLLFKHL